MANINSSMSKNLGLAEAVLPEPPKTSSPSQPKAQKGPSFQEHLDAPASIPMNAKKTAFNGQNPKAELKDLKANPQTRSAKVADTEVPRNSIGKPTDNESPKARPDKPTKPVKSPLTAAAKTPPEKNSAAASAKEASVLVLQAGDIPAEDEATLEAVAFDAKSSDGEPWQKRLEDMLSFMGVPPQALQQELPALAILTGQLQTIEPESIPGTLAESPLLNDVMASQDPEALMAEVKPLGVWLDEMGWSPDGLVVKDPEAFQDFMNTPVSLKDVMKSLDVDIDRVLKEAIVLQETLPMDGATPYIQRASRMQADSKASQDDGKETKDEPLKGLSPELLALLNSGAAAAPQDSSVLLKRDPAPKSGDAKVPTSIDQLMSSMGIGTSSKEALPKVALTQDNPFQSLELASSETFQFEANIPEDSAQALNKVDSRDWLENLQASQIQVDSPEAQAFDKTKGFSPEAVLDRLGEMTIAAVSEGGGEDSKEDLGSMKDPETSASVHTQGTQKSQNTFELGTAETQKAQPTHPVNKAVFEKAEMLVKEGGGAIRIDIGNQETGAIDLAVEVKDGVVEVKISAENPEARQLIAQELPKLKESLQNQNLNLSRVEVGVSGGSSWTSSDGRSSQQESSSSSSREELLGINGKGGRKTSRSYSRVSSTQEIQPGVTREGGGIQVRV